MTKGDAFAMGFAVGVLLSLVIVVNATVPRNRANRWREQVCHVMLNPLLTEADSLRFGMREPWCWKRLGLAEEGP